MFDLEGKDTVISRHLPEQHGYALSSVPVCGVASPLSSAEALWGSLPADVGDDRFPLVFRRWLAINSIPPQHGPSGDSTSLWCRTRASSGSPAWKTEKEGFW